MAKSRCMESDPISDIRTIIGNQYDSNSILKELIQNARDGKASNFYFKAVKGNSNASHELLRTDALVAFNDGDFDEEDADKITNIGSSHKLNSKSNVGKYGLGMKSIFHYCDAFFYVSTSEIAIVNPWSAKHAKTHASWNMTCEEDDRILDSYFKECQKKTGTVFEKGFMLYVPLRNNSYEHYISKNKIEIETLWQSFDYKAFTKSLVDILAVLTCSIKSNLQKLYVETPQINTKLELIKYNSVHNEILVDEKDSYDIYYKNYEESTFSKLLEIKQTGKLPEKTEYDEETDSEKVYRPPYEEKQTPTLVSILHKNNTSIGNCSFQFCCYLPLDDKNQVLRYKNETGYDCDIFMHCEFETDSGRKSLLGVDFSKDTILFPANQIQCILKEDEAQHWWNISIIQELLSSHLPDLLFSSVIPNIQKPDTIVFNYHSYIQDIFKKNSDLINLKFLFYKKLDSDVFKWKMDDVSNVDNLYLEINRYIKKEIHAENSFKDTYAGIKSYINSEENFLTYLNINRLLGTTQIVFNDLFTENKYEKLLDVLIENKIPIVFSPDCKNKIHLSEHAISYLSYFFGPYKDSEGCECSDILNSFEYEKDALLDLCERYRNYPICKVHNVREKNPAKNEYFTYEKLKKLYDKNCLYAGYLQNIDYLIHNLLRITESLNVYSISEKNILSRLFQDENHKLLDVSKTEHVFSTIISSDSVVFTKDEALLSTFIGKVDSYNDSIPNYLPVMRFIVTNDRNRNGIFVYCDCQESDLYTKLFSNSDNSGNGKIFISKSICDAFKQKDIPFKPVDSGEVKTYLKSGKKLDFSIFSSDEKDRFLLTLMGDVFKQVPLHQTVENEYVSFTDSCYLIVDETIKLPKGYSNKNISFIKLSTNRELQERQKDFLKNSIFTKTKALEILYDDNDLNLTDNEINSYLIQNIDCADISILNSNENFRNRNWIELSTGEFCSPNEVINLDSIDKNITIKNSVENIYTIEDLSKDYQSLKNRNIFLEDRDAAIDVLLCSYPRKIIVEKEALFENWDVIKPSVQYQEKFYQLVDCIFDNDKRKRYDLLSASKYVEKGSFEDYANFITSLSNSNGDYSIIIDLVHLCLEEKIVQENLQSFLSISSLKLPTENGGWNLASNISNKFNRSFSKKQQLNQRLVDVIKISEEDKTYVDQENFEIVDETEEDIKNFFEKIVEGKNEIDPRLVGFLLFLLGGEYRSFAENNGYFTDTDKAVLKKDIPFCEDFTPEHWISKCSSVQDAILKNSNPNRFCVILQIRKGGVIKTKSLCNSVISVDITNSKDGHILSEVNLQTPYNKTPRLVLQFLYNDLSEITSKQLKDAIQYVYKVGYYQSQLLDDFYEKLLVSEQASIECTKRAIFKEIFGTLKILKLKEYFSKEFDDYNEANFSESSNDRQIILDLQNKICDKDNPAIKEKILSAVRGYLSDNQYDSTRILYELLQNADDAVGQQIDLLEKTGKDSKNVIREFIIEKDSDTFIISHYGREINFRPSEQFPNSYKYDLSNMIQIANSDKPGQMNTTGKFGLGFKSVYFLCNQPIIRSGRLQFKIIAGLYPEKCGLEKINNGETRFELRNDRSVPDLLSSFEKNIELAIIFSNFIRSVSLYGKKYIWNPAVTKINESLVIEEGENFTAIRMSKGITLVFQNKNGRIVPLADKYQKVWHTAPLFDEFKKLPYALNCKFEVDTGRKSLAKGDKNEKIILDSADIVSENFVELYKHSFKNIAEMVSIILDSGLKSEDTLRPFAEKICSKLYSSCGVISDGYNGFVSLTNTSRVFAISETCMENYVSESKYPELFEKIKTLLLEHENNILISDTAKSLCLDNIKKYIIEKENSTRFGLIDYLYYSNPEHKISSNLFALFIQLGLFELANDRNEILNENSKLLATDGNWYTVKDIFTRCIELDDSYSQYRSELCCLIKIKQSPKQNEILFNDFIEDEFYDEFNSYIPTKSIPQLYDEWHSKTQKEKESAAKSYYSNLLPDSVDFKRFVFSDEELSDSDWFIVFLLAIYQSRPFCKDSTNKKFLNQLDGLDKTGHFLDRLGSNKPSKNPQVWIDAILKFLDRKTYNSEYSSWLEEMPNMIQMAEFKDVYMQVFHDLNKLPEKDKHSVLTPEVLNEYSGSSIRKAPTIDKTVRIGFSLIIRELIRRGELMPDPKIEKFAFMPKSKCIKFVLGGISNPHVIESEDLYRQIVREIGSEKAKFDGYYDIPLLLEVRPGERS